MNWGPVVEQDRGVSEVIGTVLIISMVILAAVLLIAIGGMALQSITGESTDTVTEQSFQEMDSRISEITQSSAEESTTFAFPEGTGEDLETTDDGALNVTVEPVMNRSAVRGVSGTDPARCDLNEDVELGTVIHEESDDEVLAYQGGGLWRLTDSGVEVMTGPDFNYDGESVDFSFVNVSGAGHFDEEITIDHDPNSTTTDVVRSDLRDCWTADVDESGAGDGIVPVNMTVTIHSTFAEGWAVYATGQRPTSPNMRVAPDDWNPAVDSVDDEFEMQFSSIGEFGGLCSDRDTFGHSNLIYAGPANGTQCTEDVYHPDSEDGFVVDPADDKYSVGILNESGGWEDLTDESTHYRNGDLVFEQTTNVDVTDEFPHDEVDESETHDVYRFVPENADGEVRICITDDDAGDFEGSNCLEEQLGVDDPELLLPQDASDVQVTDVTLVGDAADGEVDADAGETLEVEAEVENEGDADEQYIVLWDEDAGALRDFENESPQERVEFDEDYDDTITFEWTPASDDAGIDRNFRVATEDDYESFDVDIISGDIDDDGATYTVDDANVTVTSSPVEAGSTVVVEATVVNEGSETGSQFVTLQDFDGNTVDFIGDRQEIAPGDAETVYLEWETDASDVGDGEVTVRTDDDLGNDTVQITDSEAAFEPFVESSPDEVNQGQTVTVNASVEEVNGVAGTGWIRLEDPDGNVVDLTRETVAGGGQEYVELQWDTSGATMGDRTLSVVTDDHETTADVTVLPSAGSEAFYNVKDISADPETVTEGETIEVTATIDNVVDEEGAQTVILSSFDNTAVDLEESVELDGNGETTVTLEWETSVGDAGTGPLTVSSADGSDSVDVTVEQADDTAGLVYVGLAEDSPYWDSGLIEPDTAYQAVGVETHGVCGSETDAKQYGDSGTDVVCREVSAMESGYLLDDDEYTLYLGDTETNEWLSTDPLSESDPNSVVVHSEHTNALSDGGYAHGDIEAFYFADPDQPVCLAEDGASIDPSEACGDVVGGLEQGDGNFLEADASEGNLTYLTAQVGEAIEQEEIEETRPPVDVVLVLDETGSMAQYDTVRYDTDTSGVQTVPDGEIWRLQDTSGWGTDDVRYHVPGERVDFGEYSSVDRVQVLEPEFVGEETRCGFLGCYTVTSYDPLGDRVWAARTLISGLNQTAGDQVGALEFDTSTAVHSPLSNDHDAVAESIAIDPGGSTDITLGMQEAEERLEDGRPDSAKAMVVLTDGIHNRGDPEPEDYAKTISDDIDVYTVGFGGASDDQLREIAEEGGSGDGEFFRGENADELDDIFADVADEVTSQDPVIERDTTTVTTVNGADSIESDGANLNDPERFNDTGSEPLEQQLDLTAEDLHFELTLYECEERERTGETVTGPDGTEYEQTECTSWDEDSTTTIDNSSIDDHIIITDDNDNTLADIDSGEFWQPDPETLDTVTEYTDGDTAEPDLADNEALVALNVDAGATGGQSGYVLMHFEVEGDRDDWQGDVGDDAEPVFEVTNLNDVSPDPATVGDDVTVEATIENTGEVEGEQAIILTGPDGHHADHTTLDLDSGGSETVTLDWTPTATDENATLRLATANDYAETSVEVQGADAGGSVLVEDVDAADTVTAGSTLTVDTTVSLDGDGEQTQAVVLRDFDGRFVDATQVTLSGNGDEETVTLEWEPTGDDVGTDDVNVTTEDDFNETGVTVESDDGTDASDFVVLVDTINPSDEIEEGETFEFAVDVTNSGNVTDTQSILLSDLDGNVVDAETVQLDAGETTDVTLEWDTEVGDAGAGDINVTSDDDYDAESVTVTSVDDPDRFEVESVDNIDDPVGVNETVEVTATISSDESGTEHVMLDNFDGNIEDFTQETLGAGSEIEVTLEWTPDGGDAGKTDDIRVYTESDTVGISQTVEVTVSGDEEGDFGQDADDTGDPVNIDISDVQVGS